MAHYPVFEEQVSLVNSEQGIYRRMFFFIDGENWLNSYSDLLTPDDPSGSALQGDTNWNIAQHSDQL